MKLPVYLFFHTLHLKDHSERHTVPFHRGGGGAEGDLASHQQDRIKDENDLEVDVQPNLGVIEAKKYYAFCMLCCKPETGLKVNLKERIYPERMRVSKEICLQFAF